MTDDPARWTTGLEATHARHALAARLAAVLPRRPRVLVLGTHAADLFGLVASALARPLVWTVVEPDSDALDAAFDGIQDAAQASGYSLTFPGQAMLVHTRQGAWRVEGALQSVASAINRLDRIKPDAIVSDSLPEILPPDAMALLPTQARLPLLATLVPDGRIDWTPAHRTDRAIAATLRAGERSPGGDASARIFRAFAAHDFAVSTVSSPLRVPASAVPMIVSSIEAAARLARATLPAQRRMIDTWEHARLDQARRRRLALRIGHRDILALPQ